MGQSKKYVNKKPTLSKRRKSKKELAKKLAQIRKDKASMNRGIEKTSTNSSFQEQQESLIAIEATFDAEILNEPQITPSTINLEQNFLVDTQTQIINSTEIQQNEILSPQQGAQPSINKDIIFDIKPIFVGRRIVDVDYFLQQIQQNRRQHLVGCGIEDMEIVKTFNDGLSSKLILQCKMCRCTAKINTCKPEEKINEELVAGALSTGIGFSQSKELLTLLNIPSPSNKSYIEKENIVGEKIDQLLLQSMEEAGREEYQKAIAVNDVDIDDGIPFITVITDASWAKRSYGTNYNSSSGVACIIGSRTRKILFIGIRNRFCYVCSKHSNETIPEHKCFKNWNKSSTAMEADIIVEGFNRSIATHKLRYANLIGDGDSSVHNTLVRQRPYGDKIVRKIECVNHLLRNFSKNMKQISLRQHSSTRGRKVPCALRKLLIQQADPMRRLIKLAASNVAEEEDLLIHGIGKLQKILKIIPNHVFGDHSNCNNRSYLKCNLQDTNHVDEMKNCGLFDDIIAYFQLRIIRNAESFILSMTTNDAERYNSLVCKFIGGKRIDFTKKGSYTYRCQAAALSYNEKSDYYEKISNEILAREPLPLLKEYIANRKKAQSVSRRRKRKNNIQRSDDDDYGPKANLNYSEEEVEQEMREILNKLQRSPEELRSIEEKTRGQVSSTQWMVERLERITASLFGRICKMKKKTSPIKFIRQLLERDLRPHRPTSAMKHGIISEDKAKAEFQKETKLKISNCGLFIDESLPYLGASPDGLIGDDAIIEIKCPYVAKEYHPIDGIKCNKIKYAIIENNKLKLKRKDNYYYQIQGQLLISKRKMCYFVVWTPKGIAIEKIELDREFCNQMIKQLKDFYNDLFLPELAKKKLKERSLTFLQ